MAIFKLTEAKIRELPLGSGIHRDSDVKGLLVICHKTCKSYAVQPKRTIGAMVGELLLDPDLGYEEIVELVRKQFPDAKTSARSVASVAAVMRKKGTPVPLRKPRKA